MPEGKWIAGLAPDMPATEAARIVLDARFEPVRRYLPLAAEKPFDDSEHVHQLRVGTRRATAAMRVFKALLPRKLQNVTRRTLRQIRRAAGDARDWDVFIATLPEMKSLASEAARPTLDFLLGFAFGERAAAQRELINAAADAGPLFAEYSTELPARVSDSQDATGPVSFGTLAGLQLGELLRTFTADVNANPTEPAQLHVLRIDGKRLRYALELFVDCFPPVMKETVYPAVEEVQELLGDIQDAVTGINHLAAIRTMVKQVAPRQLTRVRHGLDSIARSLRAKLPAGKKAFIAWRKQWQELMDGLEIELVLATSTT